MRMKKILVAEDNPVNRELIREILGESEYEVIEACDGQEALDKIAEARPDLVLLDIQMPVLDGYAVLRRLRDNPPSPTPRVIALTAYAMQGDRERALAAGFDDYVTKPIDVKTLTCKIGEALG
jgi:two-component system, cell cycle response regulator DivK